MHLAANVFDVWVFRRRGADVEFLLLYTSVEKAARYFNAGRCWQIPSEFVKEGDAITEAISRELQRYGLRANAVWAGAGRSDTDHLPNVTGVYLPAAYEEMIALVREVLPQARVLGTLYVPSEVNTVYHRDRFVEAARKAGLEIVTVAANTAS